MTLVSSVPGLRGAVILWSLIAAAAPCDGQRFDVYGGLRATELEATGWFRLDEAGGRDVLVSPDGHAYAALGVNHIGALERAEGGAFEREYGKDWGRFRSSLVEQLRGWHMTTLGYGSPPALQDSIPYFATLTPVRNEKHRSHPKPGRRDSYEFPDVFDPEWARQTDRLMGEAIAPHRNNRFLIGYFWTDTPTWDLVRTRGLRGTDWVSEIRRLPASAAGRARYVRFLLERYAGKLDELNEIYGLELEGLDELAEAELGRIPIGRHRVREDDEVFLGLIAERYFKTVGESQRRHDRNHLVMGERYLAGDAPDAVLRAAAPYIDAVSVQPGDRYTELYPPSTVYPDKEIARMQEVTDKPVMICDHTISYPTKEHPRTIFEQAPDARAAAEATETFIRQAMAKPYMLGYLRCQYIDRPSSYGRGLRQGLLDASEAPRELLSAVYTRVFGEWLGLLEGSK